MALFTSPKLSSLNQAQALLSKNATPNHGDTLLLLQERLQKAFELIDQLRSENDSLKKEIEKNKKSANPILKKNYEPTWEEEEELVNKETAWLLPKSKKRKASSPLKDVKQSEEKKKTKAQKPPPIVISNLTDATNATGMLQELKTKKIEFNAQMLNNNQMKVNVTTADDYRTTVDTIRNGKLEWHTYESKQTRPIRVVLRGLHVSCNPETIKEELITRGFKITEVQQRLRKTKEGLIKLPLFTLTFNCSEDVKKVYEITNVCYMKVKVEALRISKQIPQCKNCQRFGHTKSFCNRRTICVKCAGQHDAKNCPKSPNDLPKCSNCAEAHPASYRGCIIAKELQKRRNQEEKKKVSKTSIRPEARKFVSSKTMEGVSYAQKASSQMQAIQTAKHKPTKEAEIQTHLTEMMQNMIKMMNSIQDRLDRVEARQTGAIPRRPM